MSNMGAKLGVEGEREFKAALKEIRQQYKLLGSEMKVATSSFDANEKSVESLTAKNTVLEKGIDQQKETVAKLSEALKNASASFGENDKRTTDWKIALNDAQSELNKMERELQGNNQALAEMSSESGQAADATQQVGDAAEKSGEQSAQSTGQWGKFAAAIKTGVVAAAKAAAAAVAALGAAAAAAVVGIWKLGNDAGDAADELLTLSAQTNISVKTLQELDYASRFVDVSVADMAKGMQKVTKAVGEAASSNKNYIEIAKGVKIGIKDTNGEVLNSENIFYAAVDSLGAMENQTLRDAAAQDLFGKSYEEILPLVKAGSGALSQYAAEANAAGLVLSDSVVAKLGQFDDIMEKTDAQVTSLKRQLAVMFLPALQQAGTAISDVLSTISGALSDGIQPGDVTVIGEKISGYLLEGLDALSDALPSMLQVLSSVLTKLVSIVVRLLPKVIGPLLSGASSLLSGLVTALVGALPTLVPALLNGLSELLTTVLTTLASSAPALSEAVVQLVMQLMGFIADNLPLLIECVTQIITSLASALSENVESIIGLAITIIETLVTALLDNLGPLLIAAQGLIVAIVQGILANIDDLLDAAITIILSLVDYMLNNLGPLLGMTLQMILTIAGGLITHIPKLLESVVKLITSIINKFIETDWGTIGSNIIDGIWAGISAGWDWLVSQVQRLAKRLLDAAKEALGIASPSKEFAKIGAYMAQGLSEGWQKSMQSVSKQVSSDLSGITVRSSKTVSGGAAAQSGSGTPVINQYFWKERPQNAQEIGRETRNGLRRAGWGIA